MKHAKDLSSTDLICRIVQSTLMNLPHFDWIVDVIDPGKQIICAVVLAMGPNSRVGSGFGSTRNRTIAMGLTTRNTGTIGNRGGFTTKNPAFKVHNFRTN
jgi:hypothetical protein